MTLRTLRERLGLPLSSESMFAIRLLVVEVIVAALLLMTVSFGVIPAYVITAMMFAGAIWFQFFGHLYGKTAKMITEDGWEKFLDGREELGEYEELGGTYEYHDADDDDDDDDDEDSNR